MLSIGADIARIEDMDALKRACMIVVEAAAKGGKDRSDLVWWGLGSMVFSSTLCGLISTFAYISIRRSYPEILLATNGGTEVASGPVKTLLMKLYSGKLKLWKAFWLIYLPGIIVFPVVVFGLYAGVKKAGVITGGELTDFFVVPLLFAVLWLWNIALCTAVWRNSDNTNYRIISSITRVALVLSIAVPILKFVLLWANL